MLTIRSSLSAKPDGPVGIILSHSSFPDPSGSQDPLGWSWLSPATFTRTYGITISALGIPSGSQERKSSAPLSDISGYQRASLVPETRDAFRNLKKLPEV